MSRRLKIATLILVAGLIPTMWEGCGAPSHENYNVEMSAASAGFTEFKKGFYEFTQTQGCNGCHAVNVSPHFAAADVQTAYFIARDYVDFDYPLSSVFIERAINNHCGTLACSSQNAATVKPQVENLILAWAAAEGGLGNLTAKPPNFVTSQMALPAAVPTLAQTAYLLRFNLSTLQPGVPEFANAILELQVQMSNVTEYRFRNPKIVGSTAPVSLTGIHVFVKAAADMSPGLGREDKAQGDVWANLAVTVPVVAKPNPLPTTTFTATALTTLSLNTPWQAAGDLITIGFDDITGGSAGGGAVPASVTWTQLVTPTTGIFARSCLGCHGTTTQFASLNLADYNQAKAKASLIQTRINSTTAPMPPAPTGLMPAADRQVVNNWVMGGAPQ